MIKHAIIGLGLLFINAGFARGITITISQITGIVLII